MIVTGVSLDARRISTADASSCAATTGVGSLGAVALRFSASDAVSRVILKHAAGTQNVAHCWGCRCVMLLCKNWNKNICLFITARAPSVNELKHGLVTSQTIRAGNIMLRKSYDLVAAVKYFACQQKVFVHTRGSEWYPQVDQSEK